MENSFPPSCLQASPLCTNPKFRNMHPIWISFWYILLSYWQIWFARFLHLFGLRRLRYIFNHKILIVFCKALRSLVTIKILTIEQDQFSTKTKRNKMSDCQNVLSKSHSCSFVIFHKDVHKLCYWEDRRKGFIALFYWSRIICKFSQ